jgi:alkyl hydroperoxide reductase subunit AhpF
MNTAFIHEPARKTPVLTETDVLVLGSGPSGLAAAVAAARQGVDTLLVERYGCFGGNITQAMAAIAALRQMMCCTVTGQGAGTAAAVAVKTGTTCRKVDIKKVQSALKRQGVRIQ